MTNYELERIKKLLSYRDWESRIRAGYIRSISLPWMLRALEISPTAAQIGLALWYRAGITKSQTIKLPPPLKKVFGIRRRTYALTVPKMEEAGLIKVERSGKKAYRFTILLREEDGDYQLSVQ